MAVTINRRESAALINSLTAGVVPRIGLRHIAVGRHGEVKLKLSIKPFKISSMHFSIFASM